MAGPEIRHGGLSAAATATDGHFARQGAGLLRANAALAFGYFAAAELARAVALAGGAAMPIWPAAGLALAGLLIWGPRCWPGVWLGYFTSHLLHRFLAAEGAEGLALVALPALVASGAALQAVLGMRVTTSLLHRVAPLSTPKDVLAFLLLGGPLSCAVSASVAIAAQGLFGGLAPGGAQVHWLEWWSADVLGVLLVTPLFLAFMHGMRTRRGLAWPIAVPLAVTMALVVGAHVWLERQQAAGARAETIELMQQVLNGGEQMLPTNVDALYGVERFFAASDDVTAKDFATFSTRALSLPALQVIEWAPRITAADRATFEEYLSHLPGNDGRIRPVADGGLPDDAQALPEADEYFPVLYVAPDRYVARSGLDHDSDSERHKAMQRARDTGKATGTPPRVFQTTGQPAIMVFVPVYRQDLDLDNSDVELRRATLRGYVVAVYELEALLETLARGADRHGLNYRVTDVTPGESASVIAGASLANGQTKLRYARDVEFAGRVWRLELERKAGMNGAAAGRDATLLRLVSLLGALLVAFTAMTAAGRSAAVAAEVEQRTAELRDELAARTAAEAAAHLSEQSLAITLDSIGDAVLATDIERRITRMNPAAEALTGWPLTEARGRPVDEVFRIFSEVTGAPAEIPVDAALRTGAVQSLANHTALIARDGRQRSIADSAAPIRARDGAITGVVLVFRDVSLERAAALALERSEARYREFIEHAPLGVFVQSAGRFAFVNSKTMEILGAASAADLLGLPILDFLHPDGRDAVRERMRLLNEAGQPVPPLEEQWLRIDGSVIDAEAQAVPYQHEGQPAALVFLQDVSARKLAERQRDRFFDMSVDLLCIAGMDGSFRQVNPAFGRTLGFSDEELCSQSLLHFVHPDDRAATIAEMQRLDSGKPTLKFENRYRCADGSWRWLSWKVQPYIAEGLYYGAARDVTHEREAADQRQVLEHELVRARLEAETANRAKSEFLATMSHEIRTPLNGVIGMVDVLHQTSLRGYQVEMVNLIRESAHSLLSIIEDILDFSKIEAGKLELEVEPFDLAAVIKASCGMLQHFASRRGVDLTLFTDPAIPSTLLGDAMRLRQVLVNLTSNAIKFSSAPGFRGRVSVRALLVEADRDDATIELHVTDNGIGMDQAVVNRLFQPFTQADASTTRRYGGTGLGLTIVRHLIDQMNGSIDVESEPGQGSRFTIRVRLPQAASQAPDAVTVPSPVAGLHCIVVGDELGLANDFATYLGHAGADVIRTPSLEEAGAAIQGLPAERAIWIVDSDAQAPQPDRLRAAAATRGGTHDHFVVVGRGQRHRPRSESPDLVTIDANAMTRRTFLNTVALAAGRIEADDTAIQPGFNEGSFKPRDRNTAAHSGRLILVAEDNVTNQEVIRRQLALLGYAVDVVADGRQALERWADGTYSLVLTDLHMPQMDGYDLVRAIRLGEAAGRPRTPVIALTANALRDEAERCIAAGMDAYLSKPILLNELKAELARWVPTPDDMEPDPSPPKARTDPHLDLTVLAEFLGSDKSAESHILRLFEEQVSGARAELHDACEAGDLTHAGGIGHRLKSSARAVGAMRLGELSEALEKAATVGDAGHVLELYRQLSEEAATVEHRLRERGR